MFYRFTLLSLFVLFTACGKEQPAPSNTANPHQLPVPLQSWCDASLGGSPGTRAFAVDFSRAHVGHSLFGPTGDWLNNDKTLTALLWEDAPVTNSLLSPYANSFESVCALNANENEERNSNVSMTGTFAVITPGLGEACRLKDQSLLLDRVWRRNRRVSMTFGGSRRRRPARRFEARGTGMMVTPREEA